MKMQALFAVVLIFAGPLTTPVHAPPLEGCLSPTIMAEALTKIQRSNWKAISADQILSVWPSHFDELKCQSEKGCRILVSKNRVIAGHCECCEAFVFDVEKKEGGPPSEYLNNIIIHYSERDKGRVIEAAKELAQAAGLPNDQIAAVGGDTVQRFEWTDRRELVRQSYVAEMHFTKLGAKWEYYLSISAEAI
jgi:hypothetical protein